jgi:transcriptional regulator of acetoin/glycerol metabolism
VRRRDLPPEIATAAPTSVTPGAQSRRVQSDPKREIMQALQEMGGNRSRAAKHLGISRATFYRRLQQLGID